MPPSQNSALPALLLLGMYWIAWKRIASDHDGNLCVLPDHRDSLYCSKIFRSAGKRSLTKQLLLLGFMMGTFASPNSFSVIPLLP